MSGWKFFFPMRCKICGRDLDDGRVLCTDCLEREALYCDGRFSVAGAQDADAPLIYYGAVRHAMRAYKFHAKRMYADWFAQMAAECLAGHLDDWKPDVITFVPMRFGRWMRRGYNPSALAARLVARKFSLPCLRLLRKCRRTKTQSKLPHAQRQDNVQGAFAMRDGAAVQGKRVVLIDDVVTTGATAAVCVKALKDAGAQAVFVLSLTKTPV